MKAFFILCVLIYKREDPNWEDLNWEDLNFDNRLQRQPRQPRQQRQLRPWRWQIFSFSVSAVSAVSAISCLGCLSVSCFWRSAFEMPQPSCASLNLRLELFIVSRSRILGSATDYSRRCPTGKERGRKGKTSHLWDPFNPFTKHCLFIWMMPAGRHFEWIPN